MKTKELGGLKTLKVVPTPGPHPVPTLSASFPPSSRRATTPHP